MSKTDTPLFNCETCEERDRDMRNCCNRRVLKFTAIDDFKGKEYAHIEASSPDTVFTVGLTRFFECPLTYFTPEIWKIIDLCYLIDNTHNLLFSGGWADQPAWLAESYLIYKQETGFTDGN